VFHPEHNGVANRLNRTRIDEFLDAFMLGGFEGRKLVIRAFAGWNN
jgi:hypothetical protein